MSHHHSFQRFGVWLPAGSILLLAAWLVAGCSTTRRLPEGEVLYTGVKFIHTNEEERKDVSNTVSDAVNAGLKVEPNGSFFGSAHYRWPFQLGLWAYNAFYTERTHGLRHWLFTTLKSDPILVSQVNPSLRTRASEITMADNGYFGGTVDYEVYPNKRNARKASIGYTVNYTQPYKYSTIQYMPTESDEVNNIVRNAAAESLLKPGMTFNASDLEDERTRLVNLLRGSGFYLYSASNIRYLADSTGLRHEVALRIYLSEDQTTSNALQRCEIDSVLIALDNGQGVEPNSFDTVGFCTIGYRGRLRMKPKVLRGCLPFDDGEVYSDQLTQRVKTNLDRLNTFKYNQVQYSLLPSDSVSRADSVNRMLMRVTATYDYPYNGQLEFNVITKDNKQTGPGMSLQVNRRNCFKGGELLTTEFTSSYEWLTGRNSYSESNNLLNSYEFGLKTSLSYPRLLLPHRMLHVSRDYPIATTFSLAANVMRRSGFFQMFKGTCEVRYDFYTDNVNSHSFSPLQLSYTSMMGTSYRFDSIVAANKVLQQGFSDRFIPAMVYTYLYDNRTAYKNRLTQQWLQVSLMESGGVLDLLTGWLSDKKQGERQLFWQQFSQFVKGTIDFRNYFRINRRTTLATRLLGGVAYAYGNSSVVPYSEQFYIGGANSLRGFSVRSVGPGRYKTGTDRYAYMDQTGDIKLEGNVELRFPVAGDLQGALFADAGNIWTLRSEESRPGGMFDGNSLWRDLASDVGLGFRYDLDLLVVRFDIGVPLHDPTMASDGKYYNITGSFFGNLGYHLAVGYPF